MSILVFKKIFSFQFH